MSSNGLFSYESSDELVREAQSEDDMLIGSAAGKQVFETTDYDQFSFHKLNRSIDEAHAASLAESFDKHGFLPDNHIVVDENGVVIDGQHRLRAAEKAEVPVYFTVCEGEYSIELVVDLNNDTKSWNLQDWMELHAADGQEDYQRALQYMDGRDCPLSVIAYIFGYSTGQLRNGKFQWESTQKAQRIMNVIEKVKDATGGNSFPHRKSFIRALDKVMGFDQVDDYEKLAEKAAGAAKAERLDNYGNSGQRQYMLDLIDAWNRNRRKTSDRRIDLL